MAKKKNTSSKWIVVAFVLVIICSIVITEIMAANDKKIKEISVTGFNSELAVGTESLVLLTENDCSKCDDYKKVLEDVKKTGLAVYTINIDELSGNDFNSLLTSSSLINRDNVPAILHLSAGSVIGSYTGDAKYNDIMSFEKIFKVISVSQFKTMYAEDKEYLVYVGRPTCHFCVQSEPWTKRIAYELGKDIYHINIDEETSTDLQDLATLTGGVYKGATPLFMQVKNGKVLNYKEGAGSYDELLQFFKGLK